MWKQPGLSLIEDRDMKVDKENGWNQTDDTDTVKAEEWVANSNWKRSLLSNDAPPLTPLTATSTTPTVVGHPLGGSSLHTPARTTPGSGLRSYPSTVGASATQAMTLDRC